MFSRLLSRLFSRPRAFLSSLLWSSPARQLRLSPPSSEKDVVEGDLKRDMDAKTRRFILRCARDKFNNAFKELDEEYADYHGNEDHPKHIFIADPS